MTADITGGAGGAGGSAITALSVGIGGGGGGGGLGLLFLSNVTSVTFQSDLLGGAGGQGGAGSPDVGDGGDGGDGGHALVFQGTTADLTITGTATGGAGGDGGDASSPTAGVPGNGGTGGAALIFKGFADLTVVAGASLKGGNGGDGGVAANGSRRGGMGGAGGSGVVVEAGGALVVQTLADIAGGNGGVAGSAAVAAGAGGAGVLGKVGGASIVTAGSISGGLGGDGTTRALAISLTGDNNRVELRHGWNMTGNVYVAGSGTSNILALGGSDDSSFDVSKLVTNFTIGSEDEFAGFTGYEKTGTSTWELTGTGTDMAPWTVKAGTLLVTGSIAGSPVTVESAAILAGTGTVGSTSVKSGGFIAPGDGGIGTLNVNGTLELNSGSTYTSQIGPTSADLIDVSGTATLGGTLALSVTPGSYGLGDRFDVVVSDTAVSGAFSSVTGNWLSAFVGFDDHYTDKVAYVEVAQLRAFTDAALTRNQIAAARGADSLPLGNPLFTAIAWLPTDAAARNAFDLISGEIHASAKSVLIEDSQFLRNAVFDRLAGAAAPGTVVAPLSYGPAVKSPAPFPVKAEPAVAPEPASAVWTQAFGNWGSIDGDGNAATIDRSVGGFFIGADTLVGEVWRLGVVGGYSRSDFDVDARRSSGTADNYHAGIYGGGQWGAFTLRGGVAYTWSDIDTSRAVVFPGFADFLSASYDAGTAQAFGEVAYRVGGASAYFEPFAALAYVNLDTDDFVERGGAAALIASGGDNIGTTFTTLGLRAATDFAFGSTSAQLTGLLGWRHAFGDTLPLSTFAFEGGLPFTVAGTPVAEDALVVEAGLNVALSPNVVLGASYTGQFGDGSTLQGAKGTLVWKF